MLSLFESMISFKLVFSADDCEVSEWASWGRCLKNGVDCGYKWGTETRMRGIITQSTPQGKACPELAQTRRCRILQRHCPGKLQSDGCFS